MKVGLITFLIVLVGCGGGTGSSASDASRQEGDSSQRDRSTGDLELMGGGKQPVGSEGGREPGATKPGSSSGGALDDGGPGSNDGGPGSGGSDGGVGSNDAGLVVVDYPFPDHWLGEWDLDFLSEDISDSRCASKISDRLNSVLIFLLQNVPFSEEQTPRFNVRRFDSQGEFIYRGDIEENNGDIKLNDGIIYPIEDSSNPSWASFSLHSTNEDTLEGWIQEPREEDAQDATCVWTFQVRAERR